MMVAQQLYEGVDLGPGDPVGLITYMRTDSTRIADDHVRVVANAARADVDLAHLRAAMPDDVEVRARPARVIADAAQPRPSEIRRRIDALHIDGRHDRGEREQQRRHGVLVTSSVKSPPSPENVEATTCSS